MPIDETTKVYFDGFQKSLDRIEREGEKTNRKIDNTKKELKSDINNSVAAQDRKIQKLEDDKLSKEEFSPYQNFFQKANRLIRALLIGAVVSLVLISK